MPQLTAIQDIDDNFLNENNFTVEQNRDIIQSASNRIEGEEQWPTGSNLSISSLPTQN